MRWSCISRAGPDAPLLGGSTPSGFPIHQQSTGRCHRHLDHEFRVPVATSKGIMRWLRRPWIRFMKIIFYGCYHHHNKIDWGQFMHVSRHSGAAKRSPESRAVDYEIEVHYQRNSIEIKPLEASKRDNFQQSNSGFRPCASLFRNDVL